MSLRRKCAFILCQKFSIKKHAREKEGQKISAKFLTLSLPLTFFRDLSFTLFSHSLTLPLSFLPSTSLFLSLLYLWLSSHLSFTSLSLLPPFQLSLYIS